jgi:transposase-like protein
MTRKRYDWEAIEKDYRADQISIREIARLHGCSEAAIRKKMKQFGVERDLSLKVNQKVRNSLLRTSRTSTSASEKEIVEDAAARSVEVIRGHINLISNAVKVVSDLTGQLSESIKENDHNKIHKQADTAVKLSAAIRNLVTLERQVFNISADTGTDDYKNESTESLIEKRRKLALKIAHSIQQ